VFRQKGKAVSFENGGFVCWVEQMQCIQIEREEALQGHIPLGIKAGCMGYGEKPYNCKVGRRFVREVSERVDRKRSTETGEWRVGKWSRKKFRRKIWALVSVRKQNKASRNNRSLTL